MNDLLANPAVQAGVVPFIIAFVLAAILSRSGEWNGLGILAGFIMVVLLTTGIQFEPLTSTRKIVLLTLVASVIAGTMVILKPDFKRYRGLFFIVGFVAMLWVLWPYLKRQEIFDAIIAGGGLGIFVAWCYVTFLSQKNISSLASTASISAAGFGVGGAVLLGASALLGQMGIAIGSSAFGILMASIVTKRTGHASYFATGVAGLSLGLIAGAATVYAKLPWYALLPFMTIPILARIGLTNDQSPSLKALIWFGICMVPASLAIFLSWNAAGPVAGY